MRIRSYRVDQLGLVLQTSKPCWCFKYASNGKKKRDVEVEVEVKRSTIEYIYVRFVTDAEDGDGSNK
jgi:hypothetical protein